MFPQLGIPVPPNFDDEKQAAGRRQHAQISRREIMSVNAGRKRRPASPVEKTSDGEIKVPMIPPTRWYGTAAGAEHSQAVQLRKLRNLHYSKEELSAQFSYFLTQAEDVAKRADGFRWETLIDLKDTIELQAPNIAIAGRDNAAYEVMFRCEPSRYMSKPRYLIAMRRVFGFNIAATQEASDKGTAFLLERCYTAFDQHNRNEFDWRIFLLMYRIVAMPLCLLRDHLLFGFGLFQSSGSFEFDSHPTDVNEPGGSGVTYGNVRDIFSCVTTHPLRPDLLDLVSNAFLELANLSTHLNIQVTTARRSGKSPDNIKLTRHMFERLLDMPALSSLFEAAMPFGELDPAVWTMVIEEHFMEPSLLSYLKPLRREVNSNSKAVAFAAAYLARTMLRNLNRWRGYCFRRQRARFLVGSFISRWTLANGLWALGKWRRTTIEICSAICLQRHVRGWIGRCARWFLAELQRTAIVLQTRYRGMRARRHYFEVVAIRHWAATEIGRWVRGNFAKRLALYKLETKVFEARRKIDEERFNWVNRLLINAAIKIQRNWRAKALAEFNRDRDEKMINEIKVQKMLAAAALDEKKKRETYEAELAMWFKNEKQKELGAVSEEETLNKRQMDIARYRRREQIRLAKKKESDRLEAKQNIKDEGVAKWLDDWEVRAVEAANITIAYSERILDEPNGSTEEHERAAIMKQIRVQTLDVLARADQAGLKMEVPEGRKIATKEVIEMHAQEAKQKVYNQMKEAAAKVEEKEAEEEEEEERAKERTHYLRSTEAAGRFQRGFRRWRGRRDLRKRIYACFEKHFLGGSRGFGFEYLDLRTNLYQANKPLLLGRFDLIMPNVWYAVPDAENIPYFYNPSTGEMQWTAPKGTLLCECCKKDFVRRWEVKVPPIRPGQTVKVTLGTDPKPNMPINKLGLLRQMCVDCWNKEFPVGLDKEDNTLGSRVKRFKWLCIEGGSPDAESTVESGKAFFENIFTELDLGIPYLDRNFYDDDSYESNKVYQLAKEYDLKCRQEVRDRMMVADDPDAEDSKERLKEKEYFRTRKEALRTINANLDADREAPFFDYSNDPGESEEKTSTEDKTGNNDDDDEGEKGDKANGFVEYYDEEYQCKYWYNEETEETTYDDPTTTTSTDIVVASEGEAGEEGGGEGYDENGYGDDQYYEGGGEGEGNEIVPYEEGGTGEEEGGWCSECNEGYAVRYCHECSRSFCVDCHMELHNQKGSLFRDHKFDKLPTY